MFGLSITQLNKGPYMSTNVSFNFLNELREKIRCAALLSILFFSSANLILIISEHECKILLIK